MTCMRKTSASRGLFPIQSANRRTLSTFNHRPETGWYITIDDEPTVITKGAEYQILALLIEDENTREHSWGQREGFESRKYANRALEKLQLQKVHSVPTLTESRTLALICGIMWSFCSIYWFCALRDFG